MLFIGDVHAHFNLYKGLLMEEKPAQSLQVGDFGIGFPGYYPEFFGDGNKFIRGNHDHPQFCQQHPNYLGEFGVSGDIFYCGGGYSIDKAMRVPGVTWWHDEQLNLQQMGEALQLYAKTKPDVVVTHQCPQRIEDKLFNFPTRFTAATPKFLEALLDEHKPKLWIFGHYHISRNRKVNGTRYICLRPLEHVEMDVKL